MSQIFTVVNDDVLVEKIRNARTKIVYVAPGISMKVAKALGDRFPELGKIALTIIMDVDAEVYRMGYGETKGLDHIKQLSDENLLELRHQPGVRIGVLVTDDQTLIYSPTPQLIEAGSSQPDKPNAIAIPGADNFIERACGNAPDMLPVAEIGMTVVKSGELDEVKKDLEEIPPRKFNVARIERIFSSQIQYVDFKITQYRLSKKIAPIPSDLLGLRDNSEIQDRWRNTFRMFNGSSSIEVSIPVHDEDGKIVKNEQGETKTMLYGEGSIDKERKSIEKNYLYKLPGYDVVVFRKCRRAFTKSINVFTLRLEDYQKELVGKIEQSINETIANLVTTMLPMIRKSPPLRYLKSGDNIDDADLSEMLGDDLREHFGNIGKLATPKITIKYKDISYETIQDSKFRSALEKSKIPKSKLRSLFPEHYAAPEA